LYNKKCICEYDGTNFSGWQIQKQLRTVQLEIETALNKIYKNKIKIYGSGRTDTGVHALNQVFNFKSEKFLDNSSLLKGLNSLLPEDIVIKNVEDVDLNFHSQKSAVSKTYIYKILNRNYPSALNRKRYWWIRWDINIDEFKELFEPFITETDFSAMCIKRSLKENNIRQINYINLKKISNVIEIEINANGFLHNMVRNIVGTAKEFYFNKKTKYDIQDVLESKNIENAGATAPAHGLYLKQVYY
jgi:tRNA pseudouridine38-40 synthase